MGSVSEITEPSRLNVGDLLFQLRVIHLLIPFLKQCRSPKMAHYILFYDVIGHDVTILPDNGNERARPKLYVDEVSSP